MKRQKITISLSEAALEKLNAMAADESRNRSRQVEWLINTNFRDPRLSAPMTKVGPLVSGPEPVVEGFEEAP